MKAIIFKNILFFTLMSCLYSCSVENSNNLNAIVPDATVSIAGTDAGTLLMKNYKIDVARTDSFAVNLTANEFLKKDLLLTLDISQVGLDFQNNKRKAAGEANYSTLPTNAYIISPNPVIIKAGNRTAKFAVKVNIPASIDLANDYLLPVGIVNASDAKINSALSFVNISIEGLPSAYEGNYRSIGNFTHPTQPRVIDQDKVLKTVDKVTSETQFADLQNFVMWLKVNKDNTVTIIPKASADGLPNLGQTGTNKYDPATKKFTLNYKYSGDGGDRIVSEVISRK